MSVPPALPPGLPPLPKSLSSAASNKCIDYSNRKANASQVGQEPQYSLDCTNSSRRNHREGSLSSTQDSISDRDSVHSRASSSLSAHDVPTSTNTLDTQIALLRKEMYSLRQLDLSLLSQLWALNESIQSFRTVLQEREDVSPSPTPSNTNSISSDDEPDDQSFSPLPQAPPPMPVVVGSGSSAASQASTSTSASNSLSAANTQMTPTARSARQTGLGRTRSQQNNDDRATMYAERCAQPNDGRTRSQQSATRPMHSAHHFEGRARSQQGEDRSQMSDGSGRSQKTSLGRSLSKESCGGRAHPQLPPILQQRMRRPPPPPPPPPMRVGSKSPNRTSEQKFTV